MENRVAIFIDGSNLYHGLGSNFGRHDLNFAEFTSKLCGPRRLFRVYYYNVLQDPTQRPEGYREQQEFLEVLRRTPYLEVRLGSTKVIQGTPVEKGIDVMLATDLLYFAWNDFYDVAVVVTGDADFAYAFQAVKNMGKHIEVAYFDKGISRDLLHIADNRHLLDRAFFAGLWAGRPGERQPARLPQGKKPGLRDWQMPPTDSSEPVSRLDRFWRWIRLLRSWQPGVWHKALPGSIIGAINCPFGKLNGPARKGNQVPSLGYGKKANAPCPRDGVGLAPDDANRGWYGRAPRCLGLHNYGVYRSP